MATFFENLKTYQAAISKAAELTAANAELQAATAGLIESSTLANSEKVAAIAERDAARAEVVTAKTELAAAKLAVTEFDAKVEKAASFKALGITGGLGTAPVKAAVNPTKVADVKTLTGRERFAAGLKAKSANLN